MTPPSRIFTEDELLAQVREMITDRGLQASANELFRGAVFGRDSLWSARFLLEYEEIAHVALVSLARIQGTTYAPQREEEPGKIAHEYRKKDDPQANPEILAMFETIYGEAVPGAYIIYTTIDATPLWITLLGEYCEKYGRKILSERVEHISGEEITIGEALLRATDWLERKVRTSELGLLECVRENKGGHAEFHVLRDGKTSYRHEDGSYPNLNGPIAYLEVQGYAYDALIYAAKLLSHMRPRQVRDWRSLADRLQMRVFEQFWISKRQTFAAAIDRDPTNNQTRLLETLSTVQPEILNSGIFDSLPAKEHKRYISGVLKNFFTEEFKTVAGPRSIAQRYANLTDYYAYQGPETVWPILSHLVARGLRRQGYFALAYDIAARMVNTVQIAGSPRELFYISREEGRVVYCPEEAAMEEGLSLEINATNHGEANQTWTIAALYEAKHSLLHEMPTPTKFETQLLGGEMMQLLDEAGLADAFNNRLRATLNLEEGKRLESALVARISI